MFYLCKKNISYLIVFLLANIIIFVNPGITFSSTVPVTAIGQAAIDKNSPNPIADAKQNAIKDALNRAIIKKIGIYVSSKTITENYMLKQKKIMTKSKGYVTGYKILEESIKDDIYTVKTNVFVSNDIRTTAKRLEKMIQQQSNPLILLSFDNLNLKSHYFENKFLNKLLENKYNVILKTNDNAITNPQIIMNVDYDLNYLGKDPIAQTALIYSIDVSAKTYIPGTNKFLINFETPETIKSNAYDEQQAIKNTADLAIKQCTNKIAPELLNIWKQKLAQPSDILIIFNVSQIQNQPLQIKEALSLSEGVNNIEEQPYSKDDRQLKYKIKYAGLNSWLKDELIDFNFIGFSLELESFDKNKIIFNIISDN